MTGKRLLVAIAVVLVGWLQIYEGDARLRYQQRTEQLIAKPRPVCVGRFRLDVPQLMEVSYSHIFVGGFWVSVVNETADVFQARVQAREAEITSVANERGKQNMERVQQVSAHGFVGKLFTFGRTSVEGIENRQTVYYVNVAMEGYVHSRDTTFILTASAVAPELIDRLAKIVDRIRVVETSGMPTDPGFCFGRGMLLDPVPLEWTEGVTMFAGYREEPDLALVFHSRAGLPGSDLGRLARTEKADAELPLWQKPLFRKIRMGQRTIAGIKGEEVLEQCTELNATQTYAFDWEFGGKKDDSLLPFIHLEMSTGHPTNAGSPTRDTFLNEDGLVKLWDQISGSIRLRPSSTPEPKEGATPNTQQNPAHMALSGDSCPASGWWRCHERSALNSLQWFAKGDVLPYATLEVVRKATWLGRKVVEKFERRAAWSWISQASKEKPPEQYQNRKS